MQNTLDLDSFTEKQAEEATQTTLDTKQKGKPIVLQKTHIWKSFKYV